MINGLTYIEDFISKEEEQYIVNNVDKNKWSSVLNRRTQHYGYIYDYKKRAITEDMKAQELTTWMKVYSNLMMYKSLFNNAPDQVIINEYLPGQGISKHIDCEPCFGDTIASLSLLSQTTMVFSQYKNIKEILLKPRSLIVLSGEARYKWCHAIHKSLKDGIEPRQRRISATFRNIIIS